MTLILVTRTEVLGDHTSLVLYKPATAWEVKEHTALGPGLGLEGEERRGDVTGAYWVGGSPIHFRSVS